MELSSLSAFIGLCNTVISAGKHFANEQLSHKEERILATACHGGVVELVKYDGFFAVFAEGTLFVGKDRMVCASYIDAFRRLCELGSLVAEGQSVFTLTEKALDRARRIATEQRTFDQAKIKVPYVPFLTELEVELLAAAVQGTNYDDFTVEPAGNPFILHIGEILINSRRGTEHASRLIEAIHSLERFCSMGWTARSDTPDGKMRMYKLTPTGAKLAEAVRDHAPERIKKIDA